MHGENDCRNAALLFEKEVLNNALNWKSFILNCPTCSKNAYSTFQTLSLSIVLNIMQ